MKGNEVDVYSRFEKPRIRRIIKSILTYPKSLHLLETVNSLSSMPRMPLVLQLCTLTRAEL